MKRKNIGYQGLKRNGLIDHLLLRGCRRSHSTKACGFRRHNTPSPAIRTKIIVDMILPRKFIEISGLRPMYTFINVSSIQAARVEPAFMHVGASDSGACNLSHHLLAQTKFEKPMQHPHDEDKGTDLGCESIELHFHPVILKCARRCDQDNANHKKRKENNR